MSAAGDVRRGPEIMWAPWRMAYITAEHGTAPPPAGPPECVFCDLPRRHDDARSYILHRGEHVYVVMNLYPYNNGHLMVIPYVHVDSLLALDAPALTELIALTRRSQQVVADRMRPQGFNVGMNQGRAAGAGIADHVHMHLLPRWVGDTNFMPALGDTRVMPQHLDDTYALLRPGFDT